MLREVENLVAEVVEVNVPFMNPITYVPFPHLFRLLVRLTAHVRRGYCAFTHKAGIHAKAIPSTYEILKPEDFSLACKARVLGFRYSCSQE